MNELHEVQAVDTTVLQKFRPWTGTVPSGYFAYFLGNLTRADYWAFTPNIRALYERERVEAFSTPSVDDNILDWLIVLEAVAEARGEFTMAALGAGWGRWLVSGALAAKQRGLPFHLIGVEAEPTHFQWMLEHFRDNQIDPAEHDLMHAAASGTSGEAWFYFGKPDSWYGQSIVPDAAIASEPGSMQVEYNGERVQRVRAVDLSEISARHRRLDYLHMDVQGAELDILSHQPEVLQAKVKRVLIGTHSHEIEQGLRELFTGLGWRAQYDVPLNGRIRANGVELTLGDGVQVWINPAL